MIQAPGGPEEDPTDFAHGGWVFPYFDDSLDEPMGRLLGGSYELLLGRRTYEIFAAYWPHNGEQSLVAIRAANRFRPFVDGASASVRGCRGRGSVAGAEALADFLQCAGGCRVKRFAMANR